MASFTLQPLYYWEDQPVHIEQEAEWVRHYREGKKLMAEHGAGERYKVLQIEAEGSKFSCFFIKGSPASPTCPLHHSNTLTAFWHDHQNHTNTHFSVSNQVTCPRGSRFSGSRFCHRTITSLNAVSSSPEFLKYPTHPPSHQPAKGEGLL
jgi:hypothetical protein